MSMTDCLAEIRARAGDLSDDEILEIAERIQRKRIQRKRNRLAAEGKLDNLDQRLRELARDEADKAKIGAALARKHAALNAIVRDRLDGHIDALLASGRFTPAEAVQAVLHGSTKGVRLARNSVMATRQAYDQSFWYDMLATIQRERPHLIAMLDDRRLMADTVREMFELREGGTPGKTGGADAKFLADTFAAYAERSRTELNRLGATIGKLGGWAGPQAHDPYRLLPAGRETWTNDVLARLDLARSFPDLLTDQGAPDLPAIREVLGDIWTTITTGRDNTITGREKGEFVGPANLARSLEKHRVLHFRDADAWLEYHDLYGTGGLFATMLAQQRRAAR